MTKLSVWHFLAVLLIAGLLIGMNKTSERQDFPSTKAGTLDGWVQPQAPNADGFIVLFSSATIPGLNLIYLPHPKEIVAGIPHLQAEVTLFDGQPHHIIYSFEQGGQQRLIIDSQEVASSQYLSGNQLTGLVIAETEYYVSPALNRLKFK